MSDSVRAKKTIGNSNCSQEKKIPTEAHPVSVASSSSSNLVWIPPCKTMKKDRRQQLPSKLKAPSEK
jgi:hypothetical protein